MSEIAILDSIFTSEIDGSISRDCDAAKALFNVWVSEKYPTTYGEIHSAVHRGSFDDTYIGRVPERSRGVDDFCRRHGLFGVQSDGYIHVWMPIGSGGRYGGDTYTCAACDDSVLISLFGSVKNFWKQEIPKISHPNAGSAFAAQKETLRRRLFVDCI
jgi:hypothetical protein